jgi:trans-o-hydroxybenzylidenepyruvate hydratase-aldolase
MKAKRERLTAADVTGAWAILPTAAKPNGGDWRAEDTLDLDETAKAVEGLIAAGIDGLLSLGTLSECAALTWDEKRRFIAAVVDMVGGRIPFFAGTTSLGTRETIRQTREALDLGADGTMLGLPMWCELDVRMALQFYRDVAEASPDVTICVYANPASFKFSFPHEFWAEIGLVPQVVMAKYLGIAHLGEDLPAVNGRIRLLPTGGQYFDAAQAYPQECTAFWTSAATCGPAPIVRLRDEVRDAKASGDWSAAKQVNDDMRAASVGFVPNNDRGEFYKYNIQLEKARMEAAGWMNVGPCRPPYTSAPADYLAGAANSGKLWAQLHARYVERQPVKS